MISSQDGTEDRLPRAAFRACRDACSPLASGGDDGTDSAGDAAGATDAAELAAAAGPTMAGFSAADGADVSCCA